MAGSVKCKSSLDDRSPRCVSNKRLMNLYYGPADGVYTYLRRRRRVRHKTNRPAGDDVSIFSSHISALATSRRSENLITRADSLFAPRFSKTCRLTPFGFILFRAISRHFGYLFSRARQLGVHRPSKLHLLKPGFFVFPVVKLKLFRFCVCAIPPF